MVSLKYSFLVLGISLLFSFTGENESASATPNGKLLFEKNCAICHGKDGKLGQGGAKDLSITSLSKDDMVRIVEYGKPGMTPFKGLLNDGEIQAVVEYIEELKEK